MDYSNGEWRRTYYIYLYNPKSIDTPEYVRTKDSYVQEDISRLEEALVILKQYRLELMERYRYLSETPPTTELVLRRERSFRSSRITYRLLLCKSYPDGTQHSEQISSHPGKERKQAISEYNAYCKAHPGLPHRMDIEKAKWEK